MARRTNSALRVLAIAALAGAIAFGCGLPYWADHPWHGALAVAECCVTAAAGAALLGSTATRPTGALLIVAGLAWAVSGAAGRNAGVFPLLADWASATFFLTLSVAVLLYPTGRLQHRVETWWTYGAVAAIGIGQLLVTVVGRPEWLGYSADVAWPTLLGDRDAFERVLVAVSAATVVLALTYAAVLGFRVRRATAFARPTTIGVVVVVASVGLVVAATQRGQALVELDAAYDAALVQGTVALVVPLALLGAGVYERWLAASVTDRLLRQTQPASVVRIRDALRTVLRDPTLELLFWSPDQSGWVDTAGHPTTVNLSRAATRAAGTPDGRWLRLVASTDGSPLAVVDVDRSLGASRRFVDAAISAGRPALQNAQLEAVVRAQQATVVEQLRRTRHAQAEALAAETRARRRLEHDLHDRVQVQITATLQRLAVAMHRNDDPQVAALLAECRRLLDAASRDVRLFARGINPAVLESDGLRGALRALADGFPGLVDAKVVATRFPAALESGLFLALSEAVANAVRHAGASSIVVEVEQDGDVVVGRVTDDGSGTARLSPAGGLENLRERIAALGGGTELHSEPGQGTRVTIRLPV
ncbi:sensor histidine kinase [Cryptosporangium aurantiacum]|uniref:sensor histidine kinase n=1 Tax=Cryptosporangium aurantiacum TaxID=134849 RepID=UPI0011612F51|nr:ATP-binding protein [Cryptosporangium aurantiacum]